MNTPRHPKYDEPDAQLWRDTLSSDSAYIRKYLQPISTREDMNAYLTRLSQACVPAYAKAALYKKAALVSTKLSAVTRTGGHKTYQASFTALNNTIAQTILPELMAMKRVGVYLDMPDTVPLVAGTEVPSPFFYVYKREDIINWNAKFLNSDGTETGSAVLLRDYIYETDEQGLPISENESYRYLVKTDTGVNVTITYPGTNKPDSVVGLNLTRIPFYMLTLSRSLFEDVARIQVSLLNLDSRDSKYAMDMAFPLYTEQYDPGSETQHATTVPGSMPPTTDPDPLTGLTSAPNDNKDEPNRGKTIIVGTTSGRRFPKGLERPGYIAPPSEPFKANREYSMSLRKDIETLMDTTLSTIGASNISAEAIREQGKNANAGLEVISLILNQFENWLASVWAMYVGSEPAKIEYPMGYTNRSMGERLTEARDILLVSNEVQSVLARKNLTTLAIQSVLQGYVPTSRLQAIASDIEALDTVWNGPAKAIELLQEGALSVKTAVQLFGFSAAEALAAAKDHSDRLVRIADAQAPKDDGDQDDTTNPAARGIRDFSGDPTRAARTEKRVSGKR
jgi:hypothetical protein